MRAAASRPGQPLGLRVIPRAVPIGHADAVRPEPYAEIAPGRCAGRSRRDTAPAAPPQSPPPVPPANTEALPASAGPPRCRPFAAPGPRFPGEWKKRRAFRSPLGRSGQFVPLPREAPDFPENLAVHQLRQDDLLGLLPGQRSIRPVHRRGSRAFSSSVAPASSASRGISCSSRFCAAVSISIRCAWSFPVSSRLFHSMLRCACRNVLRIRPYLPRGRASVSSSVRLGSR